MTIVCTDIQHASDNYLKEITLDTVSEDDSLIYGRPLSGISVVNNLFVDLKWYDKETNSWKKYGVLPYPKYAWAFKS